MGWLIGNTNGRQFDLIQHEHEWNATRYGQTVKATLIASDWHKACVYMLIKLDYLEGHEKAGKSETFLRTDLIKHTSSEFGYKDMEEEMGPHMPSKPRRDFAAMVYKHIPSPRNDYARDFRKWAGIKFDAPADANQLTMFAEA